jgi:hypothetical protein
MLLILETILSFRLKVLMIAHLFDFLNGTFAGIGQEGEGEAQEIV